MPARNPGATRRESNRPTIAAAAAGAAGALAGWGLDLVTWPDSVEGALLALAIAVGGAVGAAAGKIAQRGTWPDYKVRQLQAEVRDHGDGPLDGGALNA